MVSPDRKRTPSPAIKSPKPSEGYNTLNAALSDLNDAISSLEVATTTAAKKESRKRAPWQPPEVKDATVLQSQPSDHQNRMEGVLEKKRVGSGLPTQQKVTPPPAKAIVQTQPKPEPLNFPVSYAEDEPPSPPRLKSPSPQPESPPKQTVEPVAEKQPSTRVTIEPEAQMQLQPKQEAFVMDLSSLSSDASAETAAAANTTREHEPVVPQAKPSPAHSEPPVASAPESQPAEVEEQAVASVEEPVRHSTQEAIDYLLGLNSTAASTFEEKTAVEPEPEEAEAEPIPEPKPVAPAAAAAAEAEVVTAPPPAAAKKGIATTAIITDKVEITHDDEVSMDSTDAGPSPHPDAPAIPDVSVGSRGGKRVYCQFLCW